MKKLLVGTLALGAVSVSAPVSAQMMDDVSVSVDSMFAYKSWSDEGTDEGGANNSQANSVSHVTISASTTTDSGLTIGGSSKIESATGNSSKGNADEDGHKLYVSGDWGKLQTGSGGAGDTYGFNAAGLVSEEGNSFNTKLGKSSSVNSQTFDALANDNAISYFTPNVNGFSAGFTYGDAGSGSKADVNEFGFTYSTDIMGGSLSFGYSASEAGKEGSDNATVANDQVSKSASSYGATLVRDDLTVTLSFNKNTEDANNNSFDRNYSNTGLGVSYAASDDLTLAASNITAEEGKIKGTYNETALSAVYKITNGLTSGISYTTWEGKTGAKETEQEGTYSVLWLKVAF